MSMTLNGSSVVAAGIEHIDQLYSYARGLTRNRNEAEDLVQETYVRALGAMGRLRPDSNLKGWLFTIMRNIWFNQLRQQRAAKLVEMDGDDSAMDIAETGKDPHAFYLSRMEQEEVASTESHRAPFGQVILMEAA